jgi:amino acid adenylation domain-containing protein
MKQNLVEYLGETVNNFSKKIAIDDHYGKICFEELNELSDKIAVSLINKCEAGRKPVAVFLPKSRLAVLSFVGIFKSGNFYVPLDIKSPIERTSKIINSLAAECIITDYENKEKLIQIGYEGSVLIIEELMLMEVCIEDLNCLSEISNSIIDLDPIYAIYTSGSTGTPKGVLISHRGVIDYIEWAKTTYKVTNTDVIGNQAPFYFDNSTLDIYLMIVTGATLNIIPEDRFAFPIKLIEYINEKEINFVFWVPSVLNSVSNFDAFSSILPTKLNKILFAGEAMSNKHLNYWRRNYPNAVYSNLYGPTEITVDCTYYIVDREFKDDELLPIGKACKNTQILIFSEEGKQVAKGEIGELCVRGSSLAFGYYNDLDKTKVAFVQNPLHNLYPDIIYKTGDLVYENELGEYIFLGRKDSQIKHMGYRIELGEIETAILAISGVKNACVLYDDTLKQIVAFYIGDLTTVEIRKALMIILPKYMIPTKLFVETDFPLNANGKVDRLELKQRC